MPNSLRLIFSPSDRQMDLVDAVWAKLRDEARSALQHTPALEKLFSEAILDQTSLEAVPDDATAAGMPAQVIRLSSGGQSFLTLEESLQALAYEGFSYSI